MYADIAYTTRNTYRTLPVFVCAPHDLGVIDLADRSPRAELPESTQDVSGEFCAAVAQQSCGPYRLQFYATPHAVVCVVDDAEVNV